MYEDQRYLHQHLHLALFEVWEPFR